MRKTRTAYSQRRTIGSSSGIVWALDTSGYTTSGPAILHAYDATNLATKLYSSPTSATDPMAAGLAVKFVVPTVANGKVYVGTQGELYVFDLVQ
jgi:outer membrane protein assembly factor BamB